MELVTIVISIALIQYIIFGVLVGKARGQYNVPAPAMSGNEIFERYYRVHQNTLESLILFIPSIIAFATYVHAEIAAGLGLVFIVGRIVYLKAYVKDPKSRELGYMLTILPCAVLILGGAIGAALALF